MTISRRQFHKWAGLTAITATAARCANPSADQDASLSPDGGGPSDGRPGAPDAGTGSPDASTTDAGTGSPDASTTDASAGSPDASGSTDASAGSPDAGVIDATQPADADFESPDAAPGSIADNRVVRIHDAGAQDWDFDNQPGNRHYQHIDQAAVTTMFESGLRYLTGDATTEAAWRTVMKHKNPAGFQPGDRIAIKVNNNNQYYDSDGCPNTNPEMLRAILAGLISLGAAEGDITVFDAVRNVLVRQRDGVQESYPGVVFVGAYDGIVRDDDAQVSFASFAPQRLPTAVTQAQHLINVHLFKGHGPGITGSMKNHFGTIEDPNALHDGLREGPVLAEIWSNPHIANKSRLLVTEALFGNPEGEWQPPVQFEFTDLYPERTPNSLFLSVNPVCLDSVLYDYVAAENAYRGAWQGPDTWLQIAADDFGLGIHERGTLGPGSYSPQDLGYSQIEFVNHSLT